MIKGVLQDPTEQLDDDQRSPRGYCYTPCLKGTAACSASDLRCNDGDLKLVYLSSSNHIHTRHHRVLHEFGK